MTFHPDPNLIRWRIHLAAAPQLVCQTLSTADGQGRLAQVVQHATPNLPSLPAMQIIQEEAREDGQHFQLAINYGLGNSAHCEISAAPSGGTVVTLSNIDVPAAQRSDVIAGWIATLLALKTVVDDQPDLFAD